MIHRIFLNEWKSFRSDGTSLLLVAIITACSAYGLYNGMIWAKRHERVWLEASPKGCSRCGDVESQVRVRRRSEIALQ
jgi:hypothetical protein